jgi:hypothetical protein
VFVRIMGVIPLGDVRPVVTRQYHRNHWAANAKSCCNVFLEPPKAAQASYFPDVLILKL